ncbi:hypothetical protein BM525_19225 (plasmid) [Alteromonas mediterranea]|uniref:Polymerase nucleotidyl transferase domain-containing protein n=1 Tax=Alteromonas mediterranea TaxID=314275 RepID=A0AAC9JHF0_9ALTE|nr:nucleotidyltransferase domain-containing protein [Alteromonas mediterranea]APD92017.1 hypothetical protein BM524_19030 [Alteromonas mediterranea]APD99871.1 hypothetical protein BM525_19225 [Alteromonas mediterranea]
MADTSPIRDSSGNAILLPSLAEVERMLRRNLWSKRKYTILAAHVVGSVAKGTATPDSDIDIALVIPKVRGKSSLKVTEGYHSRFSFDHQMPHFHGRRIDIQFFYEESRVLDTYSKLPLQGES